MEIVRSKEIKIVFSAAICCCTVVYIYRFVRSVTKKHTIRNVPVIESNSVFGFTGLFTSPKCHETYLRVAEEYGPVVQYNLFGVHRILISDMKLAKRCLRELVRKIPCVEANGKNPRGVKAMLHRNLFNLAPGSDWQLRRSSFKHSFSFSSLRQFQDKIIELTQRLSELIEDTSRKSPNSVVELDKIFGQMTIDVICLIAFGIDINAMDNSLIFQDIHQAMIDFFEYSWVSAVPYLSVFAGFSQLIPGMQKFLGAQKKLKQFCKMIISHLQQCEADGSIQQDSLGKALLDFSRQPSITEADVLSEIEVMFIAGHETTAHTLSWFVYALAANPEVQLQAQAEVDAAPAAGPQVAKTGYSGAQSVPAYIEAVIKESMRRFPVAALSNLRKVSDKEGLTLDLSHIETGQFARNAADCKIVIPQGSMVSINAYANQNCTRNWGEDALQIRPERWLPPSYTKVPLRDAEANIGAATADRAAAAAAAAVSAAAAAVSAAASGATAASAELLDCDNAFDTSAGNPLASQAVFAGGGPDKDSLAFFPFSYGPRNCIGMNLALMEIRLVAVELVRKFSFELPDDRMRDANYVMESAFTLRPKDKLPMIVRVR